MSTDTSIKQPKSSQRNVNSSTLERPLDPTQNAKDVLGDTAGLSGVTQGGAKQTSAEPEDKQQDTTRVRGGVIQNPTQPVQGGYPRSAVGTDEYNQAVQEGASEVVAKEAEDTASEPKKTSESGISSQSPSAGFQVQPIDFSNKSSTKSITTEDAPTRSPDNQGELDAASGTTPDLESDDDALEMAQRAGFQTEEDTEHPKEVRAGRDIDQAEQAIKNN